MTAIQENIKPIGLSPSVQQALGEHLLSCYPREACGILLGAAAAGGMRIDTYVPVRNVAPDPLHAFTPHPEDWVKASYLQPAPIGLFHSHPTSAPIPSLADLGGLPALGQDYQVYLIGALDKETNIPYFNGYCINRQKCAAGNLTHSLSQAPLYTLLK